MRDLVAALRGAWWLPVAGLVAGAAAALAASLAMTPVYTSSIQLFVSTTASASATDVFTGSQFSQQRVASYARLLEGEELAGRVADRLELDLSVGALAREISVDAVPNTVLLDVSVTDPSAERAQLIAQAVGVEFTRLVAELETPANAEQSPVRVTVVDQPDVPRTPSEPQAPRNVALGAAAGLLLGAAGAVARARLDRSVKDPEEVAALAGAPVIATVLRDETLSKAHIFTRAGSSHAAEEYRQLRTNLQFINVDQPPKVIMISSALPAEGKTTVTINLAVALAEMGRQVTIVEGDLRRPRVSAYLGLVGDVGVTNILAGTADLDDVVQQYGDTSVSVVASGPIPPNPGELLASTHMSALLDKLRTRSDYVLVDAPPLLPVADASGLAVFVDGVLLSVRYGSTRKDQLQQVAATLQQVQAKILGVVLNIVPPRTGVATTYGYGYGYDKEPASPKHR